NYLAGHINIVRSKKSAPEDFESLDFFYASKKKISAVISCYKGAVERKPQPLEKQAWTEFYEYFEINVNRPEKGKSKKTIECPSLDWSLPVLFHMSRPCSRSPNHRMRG
ncbi:MAG: hypothetical protein ACOCSE_05435, partial [Chitinivibrionales bacterium]